MAALVAALKDEDRDVRDSAAAALRRISAKNGKAIPLGVRPC